MFIVSLDNLVDMVMVNALIVVEDDLMKNGDQLVVFPSA